VEVMQARVLPLSEEQLYMARVDIVIPEPTVEYTEENQRQINQSLRTMQDKLNTSYQQELKNEQDAFNYFLS
jgi:hypothetical protein